MGLTKPLRHQGYTLIEAIMVLLVIGILGGVVVSRAGGTQQPGAVGELVIKRDAVTTVDAANQAQGLAQDIARIQALALGNGVPLRLSVTYDLVTYCDPATMPLVCKPIRRNFKYDVRCLLDISGTPCSANGKNLCKLVTDQVLTSVGASFCDPTTRQDFKVSLDAMLSLAATDGSGAEALTLDFDSVGRPYVSTGLIATNPVRLFRFSADATQSAASGTATVALRPITGFTEVSF